MSSVIAVWCSGKDGYIRATAITQHTFDIDTVLEYMGPNGPAAMPYAHSDLLSFNKADFKHRDEIESRHPMVREYQLYVCRQLGQS